MLLLVFALVLLAGAAYFAFDAATVPAQQRRALIRRAATYGMFRRRDEPERAALRERALTPLKDSLARWVLKLNPKVSVDTVNQRLQAAGLSRRLSTTGFLAAKGGATVGAFLFGLLLGGGILMAILLAVAGYKLPDIYVTFKIKSRKAELGAELPDALDLLAVSVEAGLGFDAAILKVMEHMHGPLAEEFALTLGEMRMGQSRTEALKNLAKRTDIVEMSAFTRAVIQADQLGISLGRILKVQAADSRVRRQAAAEERAMKAPIKMLFPTGLFIFPAMFVVILGPAILNIMSAF